MNYDENEERGFNLRGLLAGESYLHKLSMNGEGESLVYRIKEVEFEDGTKWKARPFNAKKAKKSSPIIASVQKDADKQNSSISKRAITRDGWTSPIFADRVLKVLDGIPKSIEGIKFQTKLHELKSERLDMVESCDIQKDALEVSYNAFDYDVEKFTTYEIKGKIFAYEVDYALVDTEDGEDVGAEIGGIYVDEEGNGYFKLRCEDDRTKIIA